MLGTVTNKQRSTSHHRTSSRHFLSRSHSTSKSLKIFSLTIPKLRTCLKSPVLDFSSTSLRVDLDGNESEGFEFLYYVVYPSHQVDGPVLRRMLYFLSLSPLSCTSTTIPFCPTNPLPNSLASVCKGNERTTTYLLGRQLLCPCCISYCGIPFTKRVPSRGRSNLEPYSRKTTTARDLLYFAASHRK